MCACLTNTQGSGNETLMQSRLKKTKQAGRCITVFVNFLSVLRIRNSATRIISLWVGIRFSSTTEAIKPPAPLPTPLRRQSVFSACMIPGAAVVQVAESSVLPRRNRSLSHASVRDFLSVLFYFYVSSRFFQKSLAGLKTSTSPCRSEEASCHQTSSFSFCVHNLSNRSMK